MITGRLARGDDLGRPPQRPAIGAGPRDVPGPFPEQSLGEVPGLGLDVLGQAQRHRAGVSRAGEGAHRLEQGGGELVGSVDAIPVLRHRLEGVAGRVVPGEVRFQLLQHRPGAPAGEDVARQAQHGQPVDRRGRRPRDHVGGAGTDGGRAGEGPEPVLHLGVAGGDVDHALLVAALVEPEVLAVLQEGLADAGHVAVTEDAESAAEEGRRLAVPLDLLGRQEPDDGLADRQASGGMGIGHEGSFRCTVTRSRA